MKILVPLPDRDPFLRSRPCNRRLMPVLQPYFSAHSSLRWGNNGLTDISGTTKVLPQKIAEAGIESLAHRIRGVSASSQELSNGTPVRVVAQLRLITAPLEN